MSDVDVLIVAPERDCLMRRQLMRELPVIREAGLSVQLVLADSLAEATALPERARLMMLADAVSTRMDRQPACAAGLVILRCDDQLEGRRPLAALAGRREALEALLDRPVLVGPSDPFLRRRLRRHLPELLLTPADWLPLIEPMAALPKARSQLFAGIMVLHQRPTSATVAHVARALEAGGIVLADKSTSKPFAGTVQGVACDQIDDEIERLAMHDPCLSRQRRTSLDASLAYFGEEAFLARLEALLPAGQPLARPGVRLPLERIVLADLAARDAGTLRLALALEQWAEAGETTGLVDIGTDAPTRQLNPLIEARLVDGDAYLLPTDGALVHVAQTVLVDPPRAVGWLDHRRPRIEARRYALWADDAAAAARLERLTGRPVDRTLEPMPPVGAGKARRPAGGKVRLGAVVLDPAQAKATLDLARPWRGSGDVSVRLLMAGSWLPEDDEAWHAAAQEADILGIELLSPQRFLRSIDALLVAAAPDSPTRLPLSALHLASEQGLPILASPALEPLLGEAAVYAGDELPPALTPSRRHRAAPRSAPGPATTPSARKVLLVTSNGVGLGHLTRLAAVARRLPENATPLFVTMSEAVGVLHQLGFEAELMPSYAGQDEASWGYWTRRRFHELLGDFRPDAVVLDANRPFAGLIEAVGGMRGVELVWMRRAMWRAEQDNDHLLRLAACFDAVLEPGEVAGSADRGATVNARSDTIHLPPISLLDETDLLDRTTARRALGLDLERPAVLLQLGSGTTRDILGILDTVMLTLAAWPQLQAVQVEWLIAERQPPLWPQLKRIRGYPVARYFRAFDFTISAAGYNSYHDILRFGLPAIFIANEAGMMDDQAARAAFAEAAEAAFDLRAHDLRAGDTGALRDCIAALMQEPCRAHLSGNARRLALPNGAALAARMVASGSYATSAAAPA